MNRPIDTGGSYPEVLKAFLLSPLDRACFDRFFELCFAHTKGYLRYLRARGYQLPLEQRLESGAARDTRAEPLDDLAVDVLGPLLQSTEAESFTVVFDYYRRAGIDVGSGADPEELYHAFTVLLRGFVRKELSRIKGEAEPQLDNLKRRFKDILKEPEYHTFTSDGDPREYVRLAGGDSGADDGLSGVCLDRLLELVETAYLETSSRSGWCRRIFELLAQEPGVRDCIYKHQLLSAAVSVVLKYCDQDGIRPAALPGAVHALAIREMAEARDTALQWLRDQSLSGFVAKSRLTENEARLFEQAFELYLNDLALTGQADLLPVYFRHVMPEETHGDYLQKYKYLFETAMVGAMDRLRDNLSQSSTQWRVGAYL